MTESPRHSSSATRPVRFLLIVFVSVLTVVAVSKWWMPSERVPWQSDLTAAKAQAREANKPILLYFTAPWCPPCQMMRRWVWTDERVAAAAAAYVPVKINIDHNPRVALEHGVGDTIPVLMVIDADSNVIRRIDVALQAEDMTAWLKGQRVTPMIMQ